MTLGKWKKIKTEEIYQCGKFYRVDKDKVLTPGKNPGCYHVVRWPHNSIIVVPVDKNGMFYLTKQHRYPINDFSLEFPAGNSDDKETTLQAAKRELQEEMHLASNKWKKLGEFYEAEGFTDLKFVAYLAEDVYGVKGESKDPIDQNLHQTEKLSLIEIERKIRNGKICSAKTMTSLILYKLKHTTKMFR